jgi:hypothetical protein
MIAVFGDFCHFLVEKTPILKRCCVFFLCGTNCRICGQDCQYLFQSVGRKYLQNHKDDLRCLTLSEKMGSIVQKNPFIRTLGICELNWKHFVNIFNFESC